MSVCYQAERPNITSGMSAPVWSGLTEKQERFAHLVAEGQNYSAAYRETYDTSNMSAPSVWREAHRVSRNGKVSARIAELVSARQEEQRLQVHLRGHRVLALLEELMWSAKSDSARLRAAELLGKNVGLFSDKAGERQQDRYSIAELEAQLERLLQGSRPTGTVAGGPKVMVDSGGKSGE